MLLLAVAVGSACAFSHRLVGKVGADGRVGDAEVDEGVVDRVSVEPRHSDIGLLL